MKVWYLNISSVIYTLSKMFQKVIIWGYPLNSHTHSFVHYGWHKAFQALGYDTFWFHDEEYPSPETFDYTKCLFITEGYADTKVPLHSSNIYIVHVATKPRKYLDCGARFIDMRYNVITIKDHNYVYELAGKTLDTISPVTFYEKKSSDRDLNPRFRHHSPIYYEAIYTAWATDLLPNEVCLEDRFIEPVEPPVTYFIGSIGAGNAQEMHHFATSCSKHGIHFIHHNPWKTALSFEAAKKLVQKSYVSPDIRGSGDPDRVRFGETGTCHKYITGYIPCRLFKNISYGKLGLTNCPRLKELFGENVQLETDEATMVSSYIQMAPNKDYILKQMEWVRDHHTYLNRIKDILYILRNGAV